MVFCVFLVPLDLSFDLLLHCMYPSSKGVGAQKYRGEVQVYIPWGFNHFISTFISLCSNCEHSDSLESILYLSETTARFAQ